MSIVIREMSDTSYQIDVSETAENSLFLSLMDSVEVAAQSLTNLWRERANQAESVITAVSSATSTIPQAKDETQLPFLVLTDNQSSSRDFLYTSPNGRSDVISGINPMPGESIAELVRRLHPNLPAERILEVIEQTLAYNKAYGNDLDNGVNLSPERQIYLTSVNYYDPSGRVVKVECPTGRTLEYTYDEGGTLSNFKITEEGKVIESKLDLSGQWEVTENGINTQFLRSAVIDGDGNLSIVTSAGQQISFLTRGDEVVSRQNEEWMLFAATVLRHGKEISRYSYEHNFGDPIISASYDEAPDKTYHLTSEDGASVIERMYRVMPLNFLSRIRFDSSSIVDNVSATASYSAELSSATFEPENGQTASGSLEIESVPVGDMQRSIQDTARAIVDVATEYGVNPVLALAVAMVESSLDNTAVGDNNSSFGPFQLHIGGKLGNLSPEQAFDPYISARVALKEFAKLQHQIADPGQLAAASQRPADPEGYARKVNEAMRAAYELLQKI